MAERGQRRVGTWVRDKYHIDAFLETGSMANVYAATHRNGSRVALKILHAEHAKNDAMVERFRREGYFANTIGHPGVVRAIDDDVTEDACLFIVMELLDGENLEQMRQRRGGTIPLGEVLGYADTVLDILAAAHGKDVLHRDMKPENVYVTKDGAVKLLDFGVARWNDGQSTSDMTGFGMVLGTPAFMPPEQALGRREEVDARSDIWAFGATLFTCLTGEAVHSGDDAKTKLIATARTPARSIADVLPEIPRAVASVIDRALAFEKTERWEDARAMREALKWARRAAPSLDEQHDRPTADLFAPTTRRSNEEEITVAFHGSPPPSNDVLTSAPPITLRDLANAKTSQSAITVTNPVFKLEGDAAPPPPEDERPPTTERLPGLGGTPGPSEPSGEKPAAAAEVPRSEDVPLSFPRPTPALSFQKTMPLAQAQPSPLMDLTTSPPPAYVPSNAPPAPSLHEEPGPLLATIVPDPKKGRWLRIGLPILLGLAAGLGIYVVVQKQRHAHAESVAAPTAEAAPPPPSAPPPAATQVPPPASASAAPPPPEPAVSVAAAAPAPKKKPKRKPKPPAAAASSAGAATATATATAADPPLPTFTVPEPNDPPPPTE